MPRQRDPNRGMVVAREAMVVIVGAEPPVYDQITVIHNKTGEPVTRNMDEPRIPAVEGIPYPFRPYQRVSKTHPAYKQSPHLFLEIDELDDAELEMVSS
jgi:hypothetical protein